MKAFMEVILVVGHWLTEQCHRGIGGYIYRVMLFGMSENATYVRDLLQRFTNLLKSLILYQAHGPSFNGVWIS